MRVFTTLAIILVIIWAALQCSCTHVDSSAYKVKVNYITSSGWRLDIMEVSVALDWLQELNTRLDTLDNCLVEHNARRLVKKDLVLKFVEQSYFSKCTPHEEFLTDLAPPYRCKEKPELDTYSLDICPCTYRTGIQWPDAVIIPMRSAPSIQHGISLGQTDIEQLNMWEILRLHLGNDYNTLPAAVCVGSCN